MSAPFKKGRIARTVATAILGESVLYERHLAILAEGTEPLPR